MHTYISPDPTKLELEQPKPYRHTHICVFIFLLVNNIHEREQRIIIIDTHTHTHTHTTFQTIYMPHLQYFLHNLCKPHEAYRNKILFPLILRMMIHI